MRTFKSLVTSYVLCAVLTVLPTSVFGCARSLLTNQLGDNQTYSCYLAVESVNYCYYECYPV